MCCLLLLGVHPFHSYTCKLNKVQRNYVAHGNTHTDAHTRTRTHTHTHTHTHYQQIQMEADPGAEADVEEQPRHKMLERKVVQIFTSPDAVVVVHLFCEQNSLIEQKST